MAVSEQPRVAAAQGPRRWREQRWLVDDTIRNLGIKWDQPRLGYTLGPVVGEQSATDMLTLRTRIRKIADFVPAVSAVAMRHEQLAQRAAHLRAWRRDDLRRGVAHLHQRAT
jgi:hypothetical protein